MSNAVGRVLQQKTQKSNGCLENREENERRGSAFFHRACPLHQLTNFACKPIVSQQHQCASLFFEKSQIFFVVFVAGAAILDHSHCHRSRSNSPRGRAPERKRAPNLNF
jgi:hypothetical protein